MALVTRKEREQGNLLAKTNIIAEKPPLTQISPPKLPNVL